jgi:hypothetical protein
VRDCAQLDVQVLRSRSRGGVSGAAAEASVGWPVGAQSKRLVPPRRPWSRPAPSIRTSAPCRGGVGHQPARPTPPAHQQNQPWPTLRPGRRAAREARLMARPGSRRRRPLGRRDRGEPHSPQSQGEDHQHHHGPPNRDRVDQGEERAENEPAPVSPAIITPNQTDRWNWSSASRT